MEKVKEDLVEILEKLGDEDFDQFKWYLKLGLEGFPSIQQHRLQNANRFNTVDLLVQTYSADTIKVTRMILGKIKRNDLMEKLSKNTSEPAGGVGRNQGHKEEILSFVNEYTSDRDDMKHLRILLYGPVGAGKSSFINSVATALLGRMVIPAATCSNFCSVSRFTEEYKTHKIRKGRGNPAVFYPFVFTDIMGLQPRQDFGVRVEDIKLAMKGHVKEGYKFCDGSSLSPHDPHYNSCPSLDDRVHVLVCVLSANSPLIHSSVLEKIKEIREAARDLGIPDAAVMTHIDESCPEIHSDVKNVHKSKILKRKMSEFSSETGIPLNCMFPVKNYSGVNSDKDEDMNTLILTALRHMINFGDDFINNM